MKKVLSLALALVMMFAVCIPAFATVDNGNGGSTTVVLVDGTNGGTYDGSWTVTIPATVQIPWGKVTSNVEYSVFCQLATGKLVSITVSSSDNFTMKNEAKTATLNYSLSDTAYTTTSSVILAAEAEKAVAKVTIPPENWNKASIDKYSGTLTFTAELV